MPHTGLNSRENTEAQHNHTTRRETDLLNSFKAVRDKTIALCAPLAAEDYVIQSMPDVSPTKWHIAHTSWFFETFVLKPYKQGYTEFHPLYSYLYNSYYFQAGPRLSRAERGHLSRPTVEEIFKYRKYTDDNMIELLEGKNSGEPGEIASLVTTGINHEQQHQELMLTDIKHVFSLNPLNPRYSDNGSEVETPAAPVSWVSFDEGIYTIGYIGDGFAYDNELPAHREYLNSFQISSRLITNGEFLEFITDGGYKNPLLWLSEGWYAVEREGWTAPLYWRDIEGEWYIFTLAGQRKLRLTEPVSHISYYEADAFAKWMNARLPREAEWETAAAGVPADGNLLDSDNFHPSPAAKQYSLPSLQQLFGDVWEWTMSAYSPYPGYNTPPGALGEYNGKFMSNQMVLRGGSCATPKSHIRSTYRNFFPPNARWQFSGLRLAKDL